MDTELVGKVALVTGASQGIGRATSVALAEKAHMWRCWLAIAWVWRKRFRSSGNQTVWCTL